MTDAAHQATALWATPNVPERGKESRASKARRGSGGVDLQTQAGAWPTLMSRDTKSGATSQATAEKNARPLNEVAENWSTPTAIIGGTDTLREKTKQGRSLHNDIVAWPTPNATDDRNTAHLRGNPTLPTFVDQWQEPASSLCGLLAPASESAGPTSSEPSPTSRRRLNPAFVEWLMGTPPGWTGSGLSETEWSLWSRRMRSCLSGIVSRNPW